MPEIIKTTLETPKGLIKVTLDRLPTEEHLYAAYCLYDAKQYCFHLTYHAESLEFKLIDNRNCPEEIRDLVFHLSKAIEHHHA